jgi:alpha-1,2-mannosyltransferase
VRWKACLPPIGVGLWVVFNLVVMIAVWRHPDVGSVVENYRDAAIGWWAGRDIYGQGVDGFLYLPSFAVLYTPFAWLGEYWGDVLWRLVSAGTLTYALWRAIRFYLPRRSFEAFGYALLLILPAASAALRNGQATTLLVALMLLATVALAEQRWWRAAILMALGFAIKPLGIVLLLLAGALYPALRRRLALCVLVVTALPLLHPDPPAAWHIYGLGLDKVIASSMPGRWTWSDITGLLDQFGLQLSLLDLTVLRVACAILTLSVGTIAIQRQAAKVAALDLFALAICYLMLMNPRTEENTYIMLAVVVALFAVILSRREGGSRRAWLLAAFCMALGCHAYGNWIFRPTELWLKPLICLAFLPILLESCLGRLFDRGDLSAEPAVVPSANKTGSSESSG